MTKIKKDNDGNVLDGETPWETMCRVCPDFATESPTVSSLTEEEKAIAFEKLERKVIRALEKLAKV